MSQVLVVDDSMSARFALTRSLQKLDVPVRTANSAEEALSVLADERPTAIFMDHVLPGMSGLDAVKKIRGMDGLAQTPIIMCSSNDDDEYLADARASGATDVMRKPPDFQQLSQLVDRHLKAAPPEPEPAIAEPAAEPGEPLETEAATAAPMAAEMESVTAEPAGNIPAAPAVGEADAPPAAPVEAAPEAPPPAAAAGGDLSALDERLSRIEAMLERLETTVAKLDEKAEAQARQVADHAGRELANRLLRAVITLKGR